LSSFQPADVLKGSTRVGGASLATFIRKGLVVMQFGISIMLIVGTVVAYNQINFMQDKDLGFEQDQVILVPIAGSGITQQWKAFKTQVMQFSSVQNMTVVHDVPGSKYQTNSYVVEGVTEAQQYPVLWVHDDIVETFDMQLVAGRGYSEEFLADSSSSIMINEAMVDRLGFGTADETLGRRMTVNNNVRQIVGVVKDFHYASLHTEIAPFVIERFSNPGQMRFFGRYAAIKVAPGDMAGSLAFIEEKWNAFVPGRPFEYLFLDQELDDMYTAEVTLGRVATGFSILAILVACLGLFGMAMFTAERRTKEIGIRKALGASTPGIVNLLSGESVKLVLVAFVIACPIGYVMINNWLGTFTYRTSVGVMPFVLAGTIVLAIAWLTVSLQSVRSALANPVDSLQMD
jgi:putative ABC transport system permease protein